MTKKEKPVHHVPRVRAQRETSNFTDPMVPLGHGRWGRASEQTREKLAEVVAFLEKAVNEGQVDYNRRVLTGARTQLEKK